MNMTSTLEDIITVCSKTSHVTIFWLLLLRLIPDVIPREELLGWIGESLQKNIVSPVVIQAVKERFSDELTEEPLQSVIQFYQRIYEISEEPEEELEQGMDDRFLDALHCEYSALLTDKYGSIHANRLNLPITVRYVSFQLRINPYGSTFSRFLLNNTKFIHMQNLLPT